MSRRYVALSLLAACGFAPATNGAQAVDSNVAIPDTHTGSGSGSGSGSGTGSGAGSGSAACPDADGDGVCDSVDDWPCGAKPSAPGSVNVLGIGWYTHTDHETVAGTGHLAVVAPNTAFSIAANWQIVVPCANNAMCDAELEIGASSAAGTVKDGCLVAPRKVTGSYLGLGKATGTNATYSMMLSTAGVYSLRVSVANAATCTPAWNGDVPDSNYTFATVCVHD